MRVHRFLLQLAAYLVRGGFSMPRGHLPPAGHQVSGTFAGVGVAASEDPAVDGWLIEQLKSAGLRNVRLDFTYGDPEGPAGRLLERLLSRDFRVVLHLLQPAEAARNMTEAAAQEVWRQFLAQVLDRYGDRVAMIEVCSTVNRMRWAGYSIEGFLAAWEIAWREVRARGLLLAGPSITDFEPFWTVGVLALLQQRGQLPDVHTDNLFSERCTEPERYDHKVFGRSLAALAKVNLVKKARLLQRIGRDFGAPRLFSPAAFWTLPRIERTLPDSEQKQADYLARYLVLCAASGALEGAWWGPLVCHREGLVDDGVPGYPVLERITHYRSVTGALADFRVRPAFAALRTFNQLIPGATYLGRLNEGQDLEVHAFRNATDLIHVVWTINARAAALADIYAEADLAEARCLGRDGEELPDRPTLATEAPLYLCWPASRPVQIRPGAAILAGVRLHRHMAGKRPYFFRAEGLRGIVLAEGADEAARLFAALSPGKVVPPTRQASLRHARNAIWTLPDPTREGRTLVLKQPVRMPLHKRFLDRNKPSKALRSWSGTHELLRRGLGAAPPVAWIEQENDAGRKENIYVCEYVAAEFTARELMAAYATGAEEHQGLAANDLYAALGQFLRTLHGSGIFFRDLSGGNILVQRQEGGELQFSLIDTGRIRVYPTGITRSRRMADMVRVGNKLDWAGRARLMEHYLGKPMSGFQRLQFSLYDLKVGLKRRFGRKVLKRLFSSK